DVATTPQAAPAPQAAQTAQAAPESAQASPAQASPAQAAASPDSGQELSPDWPEGTPMKQQSVREALRDAMAEEMRRDGDVFLMGEEVAEYQGAYKISQGLLDEFGALI